MKDVFLLDLDETLLDFPRAERENFFRVLAEAGATEEMYRRFHAINDDLWKQLELGRTTREALKVQRFETLLAEFSLKADAGEVARAYMEGFPEICHPYDGAAEFVQTLSECGRVYLATNGGSAIQRRHIALAGFAPYLSGAFISEEMGANKPSKAYADRLAAQIPGFLRERAVFLGDSLTSDMVCAERLGVDFVLYAPQGAPAGYAGACARSYGEALALMGVRG